MKKISLLFMLLATTVTMFSCKKDYSCTAVDVTNSSVVLNCDNCSKKDVEDYETEILAKGYETVDCVKK
jgi:hypothetical protein